MPPSWQAELEAIVPRTDRIPFLTLQWMAGTNYEPVQRWVIRECVPNLEQVPPGFLEALQGPDPRLVGEWTDDPAVPSGRRWITDSLVSHDQWACYHATGCFSQLFWIIQGDKGGHRWQLGLAERNYLQSMAQIDGRAVDTPAPGDLPFAEWDGRVATKIGELDRLRQWRQRLDWDDRSRYVGTAGKIVRAQRHVEERQYAEAMIHWLDGQIEDIVLDIPRVLRPAWSDLSKTVPTIEQQETMDRRLILGTASATPEEL